MDDLLLPRPCFLQFEFETELVEYEIAITGNISMLGLWDQSKALKMKRMLRNKWKSIDNIQTVQNFMVEYKFIFKSKTGNFDWEGSSNRQVFTSNFIKIIISDTHRRKGYILHSVDDIIFKTLNCSKTDKVEEEKPKVNIVISDKKQRVFNYINEEDILYEEYYDNKNYYSFQQSENKISNRLKRRSGPGERGKLS